MEFINLNKDNISTAILIQNEIFPTHDASTNYKEAISKVTNYQYFLLHDAECGFVGISGLYTLPDDKKSAWLGWFGILEKYRRLHFGSQAMAIFEEKARKLGYKYCRIYTDRDDNDIAISFYQSHGYFFEEYQNDADPACYDYPVLIGTKSISNEPSQPWGKKNMHFTEQIFKQNGLVPKQLEMCHLDEITALYKSCFLDNHYFLEQFRDKDLNAIMDTSFKDMFRYCVLSGYSYGVFKDDKLTGLSLCFDFYKLKNTAPRQFNNVFTSDYDNTNYPYLHEFHDVIDTLKKPVFYIMAIAVDQNGRQNGIATTLINKILLEYHHYTIISDVTNPILRKLLLKKGFLSHTIDNGYDLLYKETSEKN